MAQPLVLRFAVAPFNIFPQPLHPPPQKFDGRHTDSKRRPNPNA
jgi:hypothetical protein